MKINAIKSYSLSNNLKNNNNNRKSQVAFGFGEDYGYNPFVDPEFENGKNPSTWGAIKAIFGASFALGCELLGSDKKRLDEIERLGIRAEEEEKMRAARARAEREQNREDDDDDDDDLDDDY